MYLYTSRSCCLWRLHSFFALWYYGICMIWYQTIVYRRKIICISVFQIDMANKTKAVKTSLPIHPHPSKETSNIAKKCCRSNGYCLIGFEISWFYVFINSLYWNQISEKRISDILMVFGIVVLVMSLSLTGWLLADCFVNLLINLFNIHVIYMYSWFNWVRVLLVFFFHWLLCYYVLLLVGG